MNNLFPDENNNGRTLLSRRAWLKTVGVGAGAGLVAVESETVAATSDGYGDGAYGADGYGDPSGTVAVTTDGASAVGETTATLDGSLTDLGGASSADVFFEYRTANATTWSETATRSLSSTGGFGADVTGLSDGVDYEFRAVASTADGNSDIGSTVGFSTVEHSVTVSTDDATDVGETTATLNGSLTDLGNASSADVHFEYREVGSSGWDSTSPRALSSTGSFSETETGLTSGTDHEFRVVAAASDGDTDTGSPLVFTTAAAERDPNITTFTVSEAGSPNPHADISADWVVSDADGDLSAVTVSVADSTGTTVRSNTTSVGGTDASGSDSFTVKHGGGEVYDVTLRVEDSAGNSAGDATSVLS